ncbi:MAG TPA: MdtA/MuxA family multidrug efflux RND transporter periplasmic adaptor subunit [Gammaproteobacteria bacterium]|jgi:multidrug efflux system membrane fusion protein|nr:MdtA/MuxA family multidrug efflux RND transporter periplasmic adaptor subunit [Gammaproteobacteria bacterium]
MRSANSSNTAHVKPKRRFPAFHRSFAFWLIILILVVLFSRIRHDLNLNNQTPNKPAIAVVAAPVQTKNMPIYLAALGAVTPTYSVTVKTQINGIMMKVLFQEGQMVKAGEVIAEIDARPYQAQLLQYQGQLARDQALLDNAKIDLQRYQKLWKQDAVSQQTLATQQALVRQYEGDVKTDLGLIAATKVNLIYCQITSPVDGRIGLRLIDPGNVVQTSDTTGIAVINTLDPITVIFTIAEDYIPEVLKQMDAQQPLVVKAYDRQQTKLLATGSLLTIDNQVDPTTGTVKLKAQFPNPNNKLFPSQFVNARLLVKTLPDALVVPTAAVQYGNTGTFVYLIATDQTVRMQPVTTGPTIGTETVVTKGLQANQRVVTDGADNLTNGALVKVVVS